MIIPSMIGTTAQAEVLDTVLTNPVPQQPAPPATARKLRYSVIPYKNFDIDQVLRAPAGSQLPLWSRTVTALRSTYKYAMVGKSPFLAASGLSNVDVWIIPVRLKFMPQNIVFDPSVANACAGNKKPIDLIKQSPLFTNTTFKIGATNVGGGLSQFANAFQRANYFKVLANKAGYKFHMTVKPTLSISTTANNFPDPTNESCGKLGYLDINVWDTFALDYIVNHASSLKPGTLPLFVFSNVVMYDTFVSNCCIGGYHGAFANTAFSGAFQTYLTAAMLSNNAFGVNGRDSAITSHEVTEWLADPSGTNPTPPWGHIGQVSGCQDNLETGDPLSGTSFTKTMPNGVSYHIQDEAFTSWFYRQSPSTAIAGRYSYAGTFTSHAGPACF